MWYPFKHWLHDVNVKVYYACKMTGLYCDDMRKQATKDSKPFKERGIDIYHPIIREGVPYVHKMLEDRTEKEMFIIWEDDQRAIRNAHVVVDSAASIYSTGAKREVGKSRYDQWKPLVSIWPNGHPPFIARKEDDACVCDATTASMAVLLKWGTRWKRIKWRCGIYIEHWDNISLRKLIEFWR